MRILLLFCLLVVLPVAGSGQSDRARRVHFRPVLSSVDDEANRILKHIADNCELVIPPDKSIADVTHDVQCHFVLDDKGLISRISIRNITNASDAIDLKSRGETPWWLREALSRALLQVPPFSGELRKRKRDVNRSIVFSFGKQENPMKINQLGFNAAKVRAQIDRSVTAQADSIRGARLAMDQKWNGFTQKNIIESIHPTLKPNQSLPSLQPNLPAPPIKRPEADVIIPLELR